MPGGDFGWHYPPLRRGGRRRSPLGTLTLYDSSDPEVQRRSAIVGGVTRFTEAANHVHLARNEGRRPVRVMVAYLGVPKRPESRTSRPRRRRSAP